MSTSRKKVWQGVFLAGAMAAVVLVGTWEGWDPLIRDRPTPRLLAEGTSGKARWVVVQVGDCLELRQSGVPVTRSCEPLTSYLDDGGPASHDKMRGYAVHLEQPHRAERPILFGMLPATTASAEVAVDGSTPDPELRKGEMVQLQVRTFGDSGRFVVEPAPDDPMWSGRYRQAQGVDRPTTGRTYNLTGLDVHIEVYDSQNRRLTPNR